MNDLDAVGYALVLLEEICLGYDTPIYRYRCTKYLQKGVDRSILNPSVLSAWSMGNIPPHVMLRKVEQLVEHSAGK